MKKPSQEALDLNAALMQLRASLGTVDEDAARANHAAVVARLQAKQGDRR